MNETTKKIEELRNEIATIEQKIRELERVNSNYYIGVYSVGDGDYWDEYYRRLGFISEEKAKEWVEEQEADADVYTARYFEVTEEIYKKYISWENLDNLYTAINMYDKSIDELEGVVKFKDSVEEAIKALANEIGIEFLSFMHPEY